MHVYVKLLIIYNKPLKMPQLPLVVSLGKDVDENAKKTSQIWDWHNSLVVDTHLNYC